MDEAMIVATALSKVYEGGETRQVVALHELSLSIARGEFVAVVGPSGSGKSTLLNLIGAIDQPSSGSLVVAGSELIRLKADALADFRRQQIGLVFQLFNLVPVLSAMENVKLPLIPYPPKGFNLDKRAKELLAQVGLSGRANHLPSQLSGGEQQRVAIARALVNKPALLLADEPTGNLDSKAGGEVIALFRQLHAEEGMTIVMVTHDPQVAAQAGRVIELRDGRLVA